ncbi:uncharacterized protein [Rutidosis leptorrhynchoides]|uniref:uncharacterized protein n=1 Tax=Rutidosis leptorrhynchoides TaxID=125765 RepID=UPI003A993450
MNIEEQSRAPTNPDLNKWPHYDYFKFNKDRDSPDQVRNAILVVAALVATASFQAVMSPPSALISLNDDSRTLYFVCLNSIAWSSSMTIIELLMEDFPFKREIRLAIIFMGMAFFQTAIVLIKIEIHLTALILALCFFAPLLTRKVPSFLNKICC